MFLIFDLLPDLPLGLVLLIDLVDALFLALTEALDPDLPLDFTDLLDALLLACAEALDDLCTEDFDALDGLTDLVVDLYA